MGAHHFFGPDFEAFPMRKGCGGRGGGRGASLSERSFLVGGVGKVDILTALGDYLSVS